MPMLKWVAERSIPACAGEPRQLSDRFSEGEVYPRVCGGALAFGTLEARRQGLSPRVRGSPLVTRLSSIALRSIPACAGEPYG